MAQCHPTFVLYLGPDQQDVVIRFLSVSNNIISQQITTENKNNSPRSKETAQADYILLQTLTPIFNKYAPDHIPNLSIRKVQLSNQISQSQATVIDSAFSRRNDYEVTLQNAELPGDLRKKDMLYSQAAMQAVRSNAPEKALSISEKISNQLEREMVVSLVHYQIALKLLDNNNITEAQKHAREISLVPQKVEIYKRLVDHLLQKKETQRVEEVLSEIESSLENIPNEPKKAYGLGILAAIATKYQPSRGFEATKRLVKCINSTDFATLSTPRNKAEILVKLEMIDLSKIFPILAKADFERALLIAKSLQNKEASILAQIFVLGSTLETPSTSAK